MNAISNSEQEVQRNNVKNILATEATATTTAEKCASETNIVVRDFSFREIYCRKFVLNFFKGKILF